MPICISRPEPHVGTYLALHRIVASVDRTKHDFDMLEHVLRGVHAAADDDSEHFLVHEGVPSALSEPELPEIRVLVRGRGERSDR